MKTACFLTIVVLLTLSVSAEETLLVTPARKEIALTGYTRADAVVTIASEVAGRVLSVGYNVGDPVTSAPFAEIDPTFIDFQIRASRQSLDKLAVARRKNDSRVAYLEKEFSRIDRLHKGDRATEVRRDAAKEELDQARLEGETLAAEATALRITLDELEERRRRHRVPAPEGFVVVARMAEPGEIVSAGTPLGRVADFRQLVVPLAVTSETLDAIRNLPDPFPATLADQAVQARLDRVNPEFDENTRKLAIEIAVSDFSGPHRGGLPFSLNLSVPAPGLRVPRAAVVNRYENPRVTRSDTGETVPVLVLGETDGHLIIQSDPRLPVGTALASP